MYTVEQQLIEDTIWAYKRTLNVSKVVKEMTPKLKKYQSPVIEEIVQLEEPTSEFYDLPEDDQIITRCLTIACEMWAVSEEEVKGRSRSGAVMLARHMFMALSIRMARQSKSATARKVKRDHTTALSSCKTSFPTHIKNELFKKRYEEAKADLKKWLEGYLAALQAA